MLHEAAFCIFLMSNAAFSDASFPNLRYNSAVERDNGIAITHTKTQQTKMKVHVNVALGASVCGYLPRVKCQFGGSGPFCHENLSWLSVNGSLDVFQFTSMMNLPQPISNGHQRCLSRSSYPLPLAPYPPRCTLAARRIFGRIPELVCSTSA